MIFSSISGESEAGPMVQTSLVLLAGKGTGTLLDDRRQWTDNRRQMTEDRYQAIDIPAVCFPSSFFFI